MIKTWIFQLLIILIAMQSIMSVADIHLDHQDNTLQQGDLHPDSAHPTIDQADSGGPDCQHCCHCHSPKLNLLSLTFHNPITQSLDLHFSALNPAVPFSFTPVPFKPPRA
jgi:hypothetical protein